MQTKHVPPILLGVILLSLSLTTALADPLYAGNMAAVGDQYSVTTTNGMLALGSMGNGSQVRPTLNFKFK